MTSCIYVNHFPSLIHHFLRLYQSLPVSHPSLTECICTTSCVSAVLCHFLCAVLCHFLPASLSLLYLRRLLCRLFIILMVVVSVAWVPIIKETSGGQVFIYINEVINYLAPPFAAVFLLAVLVPRVNEKVRTVCYTVMSCCSQDCVLHCHVLL